MLIFDTICALSTAPYKSALATVRLSGDKTLDILSHIIRKDVSELLPNHAYFVKVYKDKNITDNPIDECVITFYKGPKSYTGFDSVDFSTHGSMFVVDELMETLIHYGARRAEKGEFSAQAYYNGKMDLLKAEGINDLINSTSKRAKEIATKALSGNNTKIVEGIKNTFLGYLAQLEYFVENQYSETENDDYDEVLISIAKKLNKDIADISDILKKTKKANKEYQGFQICIAGEPNVGKSTLLNAILGEDKAIVSPIPGTTRDVVEGEKEINGILFRFKDTAGLRETDDYVENLGIQRSYKTMESSDLILLCSDTGFKEINQDIKIQSLLKDKKVIKIATKKDLGNQNDDADISICSLSDNINPLIEKIFSLLDLNKKEESAFLGQREEDYLAKIMEQAIRARDAIIDTMQVDIASDTMRVIISLINDMMGKHETQTMEDIYQTLFSKFCLGK